MLDLSSLPPECHWQPPKAKQPLVWGTAIGAWGDTLCALGEFVNHPGRGGIYHYGYDREIVRFLEAQPFIEQVQQVLPSSTEEYNAINGGAAGSENFDLPFPSRNLIRTHLRPSVTQNRQVHRWHGAKFPFNFHIKAQDLIDCHDLWFKEFIVLQPFSLQSCPMADHWPHWEEAIKLLLAYTPFTFVLVGKGWEATGEHPRIVNLVGKIDSMMTVFALAERAEGIVTTCNSLSIYSVINNLPCLAVGNAHLSGSPYFRRWIDCPPVHLVEYEQGLADFLGAFARRFRL